MTRLAWGVGVLVLLFFILAAASSAETDLWTHCDTAGLRCEPDCDPDTGFVAKVEDEPCWLIQSPLSNWEAPKMALWAKDYRGET